MSGKTKTGWIKHVSFLDDLGEADTEDESDIRFIQEIVSSYQRDLEEQLSTHEMV